MTTNHILFRTAASLTLAAAMVLTAAACSALPTVPSAPTSAPVVSTPRATPTAAPEAQLPTPRLDIGCSDLAASATLASTFTDPVEARDPGVDAGARGFAIDPAYFVQTDGGLACSWNNGLPEYRKDGNYGGRQGVTLLVLPNDNPSKGFAKYKKYYSLATNTEINCFQGGEVPNCYVNALVNDYWVSAVVTGMDASTTASEKKLAKKTKPLIDGILAGVGASAAPTPQWSPPSTTLALPHSCSGYVAASTLKAKLGLATAVTARHFGEGGGWSLEASAALNAHADGCIWTIPASDSSVAALDVLPGGAWALSSATPFMTGPSAPTEVTIAGLTDADGAWIRCGAKDDGCILDLAVGGNWIEVIVNSSSDSGMPKIPGLRHKLESLGATIVGNLG
ncbi:MAG: hypothetical protein JWR53_1324 [Glaciihabitans sp.]|nr:hypothetical protein [Glaciihabitans sp.]